MFIGIEGAKKQYGPGQPLQSLARRQRLKEGKIKGEIALDLSLKKCDPTIDTGFEQSPVQSKALPPPARVILRETQEKN